MSEEEESRKIEIDFEPLFDEIDLDVDLSTPAAVGLTKHFDYITQVMLVYTVADAAVDESVKPGWTGLQIRLDKVILFTISNIVDLYLLGEVRKYEDDNNIVTYQAILDLTKSTPGSLGLQIDSVEGKRVFDFYGVDDMTGATRFRAMVSGFRMVT